MTKMSDTVHQNISKTYQFHVHFKISRLFFEYPSFLPLHSHPISPPLFYITSFILTSLQPGYSPLLPSLSHPISLLSHLSISLWPIARSLSHPFHRCSLPLCYPFSSVNPFPSVSRHYRSGGREGGEKGGASFSPGREDFARPPPSSGSGTRWRGGGRGGSTLERFCFAIEYLRPRFIGCRFS